MIPELDQLRLHSSFLGSDPLLVQAAGGNTSIKDGAVMWIKASGTWLRDALEKNIFVPLNMPALSRALAEDDPRCESCLDFVRDDLNTGGLRPSIETSVHGLMPQRVVMHVHCVSTIAWAIQQDAELALARIMKDFDWSWIPYARPGLQLSRAIRQHMNPGSSVLILGNHGLAVAADEVAACFTLLRDVTSALRLQPRETPRSELYDLSAEGYRLPSDAECHAAALDPLASTVGIANVYYPDHVVFLGTSLPSDPASNAVALAIPGQGVLIHKDAKPSVEPMVRCIADVFRRVPTGATLKALNVVQIDQLLNWDAEKYRQSLKA